MPRWGERMDVLESYLDTLYWDDSAVSVVDLGGKRPMPGQGMTRPQHWLWSAGRHPSRRRAAEPPAVQAEEA